MSLQDFLSAQQKMNNMLYRHVLWDLIEKQKILKAIHNPVSAEALNKIVGFTDSSRYLKLFNTIDKATLNFIDSTELPSKIYNFLKFNKNLNEEESKEIEDAFVEETKSIKRIITDIYKDNSNLLLVEPRQFEEIIAELLYAKGFEVELTKQTRDNGYDIIALKTIENNFKLKFLVECKRFTEKKVGIDIIRSFKEVIHTQNANKGIIVTTSYFTKDANKKRLETPYLLDYKDKDDILNWVKEYCSE